MAEHLTLDQGVGGSSPPPPARKYLVDRYRPRRPRALRSLQTADVSPMYHSSVLATEVDDGVEGDRSAGGAEAAGPLGGADRRARHRDRAQATAPAGDLRQPPRRPTGGGSAC